MAKKISITLWGDGSKNGNWLDWYNENKLLMQDMGRKHTHIEIESKSYTSDKIFTVARKEKEILTKIKEGEEPESIGLYSLPKDYTTAMFDYDFFCLRCATYISVALNEEDYTADNERLIIELEKKYIPFEFGEVYSTSNSEVPLLYAETLDAQNVETYEMIKKIK